MPSVAVYIPTKNRLKLLKRAVDSVLSQTFSDWELIIVDDGSDDGTAEYLMSLKSSDLRVKSIFNDRSIGACASRNRAIEAAESKLVTGLDDDDEFLPKRLETMLAEYSDDYAFICTSLYWITEHSKRPILEGDQILTLKSELNRNHSGNQVLVRKDRILSIGGFDSDFPSLQDYDCFVRLIEAYGPAKRIGVPLMNIFIAHEYQRISSGPRAVDGYITFKQKHGYKMSWIQKLNHYLQVMARRGKNKTWKYQILALLLSTAYIGRTHEY